MMIFPFVCLPLLVSVLLANLSQTKEEIDDWLFAPFHKVA